MDKRLLTAYSNRLEPIAICSHATRRKYQAMTCGRRRCVRQFTPSPLPPPFLPLFHSSANRGGNEEGGRGGRIIFTFLPALLAFARGSDTHEARRFNCLPGVQRHSHQTSWADDGGEEPFEVMSAGRLNIKCLARNEETRTQASDNAFMRKAGWCVIQVQIQASQA